MALFTRRKTGVNIPNFAKNELVLEDLPNNIHEMTKLVQLTKQDIEYLQMIDDIMEDHA